MRDGCPFPHDVSELRGIHVIENVPLYNTNRFVYRTGPGSLCLEVYLTVAFSNILEQRSDLFQVIIHLFGTSADVE